MQAPGWLEHDRGARVPGAGNLVHPPSCDPTTSRSIADAEPSDALEAFRARSPLDPARYPNRGPRGQGKRRRRLLRAAAPARTGPPPANRPAEGKESSLLAGEARGGINLQWANPTLSTRGSGNQFARSPSLSISASSPSDWNCACARRSKRRAEMTSETDMTSSKLSGVASSANSTPA